MIRLPMEDGVRRGLRAGQRLLLSGPMLVMRDQAHRRMAMAVSRGEGPPVDLRGQLVYYAGPTPPPAGRAAGSLGPTTSSRMDPYVSLMCDLGVVAFLGKGPRGAEARRAMAEAGALYLVTVGGAGALLGSRVKELRLLAYPDLGPEAIYLAVVEDFP
ncbi:MAG: fumarate hydratase C-terminal domain-containing protein, partial [Candidatus Geothermincolales bacterium]